MSFDWMQKLARGRPLGDGRVLVPYRQGSAPDEINMDVVRRHGPLEVTVPMSGEEGAYSDYQTFEVSKDMSDADQEQVAKAIWKRPKAAEVTKVAAEKVALNEKLVRRVFGSRLSKLGLSPRQALEHLQSSSTKLPADLRTSMVDLAEKVRLPDGARFVESGVGSHVPDRLITRRSIRLRGEARDARSALEKVRAAEGASGPIGRDPRFAPIRGKRREADRLLNLFEDATFSRNTDRYSDIGSMNEALEAASRKRALSGRRAGSVVPSVQPTVDPGTGRVLGGPGYAPESVAWRGTRPEFLRGAVPEGDPRWVTGHPDVAAGYLQRRAGGGHTTHRPPVGSTVEAFDLSRIPAEQQGPWTPHIAQDVRGMAAQEAAGLGQTAGWRGWGASPTYEKVVTQDLLTSALLARYKALPGGGLMQTMGPPLLKTSAEVTKVAKKRITKEDIHQKAESLGIIWDYDKPGSEPFLRHSVRVTGKTHVDDMTPSEVEALYDSLEAMEKKAEEGGHWRRLKPHQRGKGPGGTPQMGRTWVRKSRMLPKFKPMKHQASFTAAAKQQLGKPQGGGIIAAHGTGTGKTFSAINAFEELKGDGKARRALVLVPAGLRANFLHKGVEKFTSSKGVILQKPKSVSTDTEYVVVSYDAFRNNPDAWIDAVKPDTIIADEVHRAANPGSKTYQALMHARKRVPRFMGLTASVVQNKPSEIVPLLALAEKGEQQIPTQRAFKKRHVKREKSLLKGVFGGTTYNKKLVERAMLKAKVGATVHYVEDLDSSKKPAKEVETVDVPMSSEQLRLYRMSMEGVDPVIRKKIAEGEPVSQKQAMNVFSRLMRARQVSNSLHVATANMSLEEAAERTPKIKRILDDAQSHIKKVADAQVVMYTNMVHGGVDVLKAGLDARGIKYGVFAGRGVKGVSEETRQAAVEDYLAGKNKVIIITGAGAEGLSLGNTTMVQLVDGHYNPERMAQAEARGVRAGGLSHRPQEERRVRVKRYVSTLPKTFWQTITFRNPEKSVGQWVYLTAGKKESINRDLRDVLRQRSAHEQKKRDSMLYRWFGGGP